MAASREAPTHPATPANNNHDPYHNHNHYRQQNMEQQVYIGLTLTGISWHTTMSKALTITRKTQCTIRYYICTLQTGFTLLTFYRMLAPNRCRGKVACMDRIRQQLNGSICSKEGTSTSR